MDAKTPLEVLEQTHFNCDVLNQCFYLAGADVGASLGLRLSGPLGSLTHVDMIDLGWAIKNELIRIFTERQQQASLNGQETQQTP